MSTILRLFRVFFPLSRIFLAISGVLISRYTRNIRYNHAKTQTDRTRRMVHRIVAGTWRKHHQSGHDFSRPCLFFFRPRNFSSNSLLLLDKKETEHYFLVRRNYNKFLLKFRRAISLSSINLGFRGYYSIGLMSLLKSIHQWNLDRYSILFIYYTKISSKEILYTTLKALVLQHFEINFDTFFSIIFFFQRIKKSTNYQPHLNITGNKFLTLKIQYDTSSKKKKELYPQTFPTRSSRRSRSLFIPFSRVTTESWCSRGGKVVEEGGRVIGRATASISRAGRRTPVPITAASNWLCFSGQLEESARDQGAQPSTCHDWYSFAHSSSLSSCPLAGRANSSEEFVWRKGFSRHS